MAKMGFLAIVLICCFSQGHAIIWNCLSTGEFASTDFTWSFGVPNITITCYISYSEHEDFYRGDQYYIHLNEERIVRIRTWEGDVRSKIYNSSIALDSQEIHFDGERYTIILTISTIYLSNTVSFNIFNNEMDIVTKMDLDFKYCPSTIDGSKLILKSNAKYETTTTVSCKYGETLFPVGKDFFAKCGKFARWIGLGEVQCVKGFPVYFVNEAQEFKTGDDIFLFCDGTKVTLLEKTVYKNIDSKVALLNHTLTPSNNGAEAVCVESPMIKRVVRFNVLYPPYFEQSSVVEKFSISEELDVKMIFWSNPVIVSSDVTITNKNGNNLQNYFVINVGYKHEIHFILSNFSKYDIGSYKVNVVAPAPFTGSTLGYITLKQKAFEATAVSLDFPNAKYNRSLLALIVVGSGLGLLTIASLLAAAIFMRKYFALKHLPQQREPKSVTTVEPTFQECIKNDTHDYEEPLPYEKPKQLYENVDHTIDNEDRYHIRY